MTTKSITTFKEACLLIEEARVPQDIFGDCTLLTGNKKTARLAEMRKLYLVFSRLVHPDKNEKNERRAHKAFTRLGELYGSAQKLVDGDIKPKGLHENGVLQKPVTWKTRKYGYTVTRCMCRGDMATIFEGTVSDKSGLATPIIVKVPHSARDNDLMKREAKAFELMKKKMNEMSTTPQGKEFAEKFALRVPAFLETVTLEEPGSTEKKSVNTFVVVPDFQTGWYTLEEIRRVHTKGVSTRVMAFIWNRVFEGLTFTHASGVVHRAITPNHILIHSESHMGQLIDWTASAVMGSSDKVPYVDDVRFPGYFPEEILDPRGTSGPSSDIFMSAWCMVYVLGGNPQEQHLPENVEKPVREFLNKCLQPKRAKRPQTAEAAYYEFRQITRDLFGPRKFVELIMPKA